MLAQRHLIQRTIADKGRLDHNALPIKAAGQRGYVASLLRRITFTLSVVHVLTLRTLAATLAGNGLIRPQTQFFTTFCLSPLPCVIERLAQIARLLLGRTVAGSDHSSLPHAILR